MNICFTDLSTYLKFSMLSFLIFLFALSGVQGKAFPSRYRRDYEDNYHYIQYEGIPAEYSLEHLPSYQDYDHGYVHANEQDWLAFYHPPMPPQPAQEQYSKINTQQKVKEKHTWHFIDQNHVPITRYTDGKHQFESEVDEPNVIEDLASNEVDTQDDEYDAPIVVETLTRKSIEHPHQDIPFIVDTLTIKNKPNNYEYDGNRFLVASAIYDALEVSDVEDLSKKDKSNKVKPIASYDVYEPIKEKPIKEKPIKEKPIKEKPIKEKPPVVVESLNMEHDTPIITEVLIRKKNPTFQTEDDHDIPLVVEALIRKIPLEDTPVVSHDASELPVIIDSLSKKENPVKVPVDSYNAVELPVEVETLTKKEKPDKIEPVASYDIHEPIKEAPVVPNDVFDLPVVVDSSNIEAEYDTPIVVEALIRKENPTSETDNDYDTPIVIEALVRKIPPVYENTQTNPKAEKVKPKDIITKKDVEKFDIPVIEVLGLEQDESKEGSTLEDGFETQGFHIVPEMEEFNENEDTGSAMDLDRSPLAREFLSFNNNIFNMVTNIKDQERQKFKSCLTPKNETGNCMPFNLCSVSSTVGNIEEFLKNVCIIDEVFIGMCCPEFPVETVRVVWEQLKPDVEMMNNKDSSISKECGRLPSNVSNKDPWPWMASLIAKSSDKTFCGGALISEQYVITAAHCTIRIPRNQILVRLARPASENRPESDFEVIEIKRHAGYNPRTMQNDIALLKLSRRVQLGGFRRVVCLDEDEGMGLVGETANLLHWKEMPGEIGDVESLSVISSRECQSKMKTAIADSVLCTGPRTEETMCNADSGAPLIIAKNEKFEVIGILTWNRNDCDERFPTVFTRVSSYRRWIEKHSS